MKLEEINETLEATCSYYSEYNERLSKIISRLAGEHIPVQEGDIEIKGGVLGATEMFSITLTEKSRAYVRLLNKLEEILFIPQAISTDSATPAA